MSAFVTVYQTDDPISGEMLTDILVQEGLAARLIGTRNAALVGLPPSIIRLRIEVPAHQVASATELIEAWEARATEPNSDSEPEPPDAEPEPDSSSAPTPERRKSPILAAGIAFLIPGGSHFYVRRPWTGGLFLAGIVTALISLGQPDRVAASAAAISLIGIVLCDIVFAQIALRATNAGRRAGASTQLVLGASAIFAMGGLGLLIAPHLPHAKKQEQPPPGPVMHILAPAPIDHGSP